MRYPIRLLCRNPVVPLLAACLLAGVAGIAEAGPWIAPGDVAVRNDIELLADTGVLRMTVTTWPLSWGDVAANLESWQGNLTAAQAAAVTRLQRRFDQEKQVGDWQLHHRLSVAGNPKEIRTFEDQPREDAEIGVGVSYLGNRIAVNLQAARVFNPADDKEWRPDGSYAGVALGNWMLAAAMTDRWWGPGWQGSNILSSNARPIPALTLERNSTAPFKSKWLSWIGPWDLAVIGGWLGEGAKPSSTRFFGTRLTFKPLRSLELGLSRTALWCGSNDACDFSTFIRMLGSIDNVGQDVSKPNEPGDELGGFDLRWSAGQFGVPLAFYYQRIGEDAHGLRPKKALDQFGLETWGYWERLGSVRVFLEWVNTQCDGAFGGSGATPNCAYNHHLFATGYRYYGRPIGNSLDGDANVFTLGAMLTDRQDHSWNLTLAGGKLNAYGATDPRNTQASEKTRYQEIEITHRRAFILGDIYAGIGYEHRQDTVTGENNNDVRGFIRWEYTY